MRPLVGCFKFNGSSHRPVWRHFSSCGRKCKMEILKPWVTQVVTAESYNMKFCKATRGVARFLSSRFAKCHFQAVNIGKHGLAEVGADRSETGTNDCKPIEKPKSQMSRHANYQIVARQIAEVRNRVGPARVKQTGLLLSPIPSLLSPERSARTQNLPAW